MTWFHKLLGLGSQDNTVLAIKLRLNRWRHFLRTGWACSHWLDDLEEKSRGEYIFDRQYVFSTVGRVFQQSYQLAYDGTLLLGKTETGIYEWLDRQKERALSYLAQYSRGPVRWDAALENSSQGALGDSELNLDQEPEFKMLRGVISLLGGNQAQGSKAASNLEEIPDLRRALRWIHEKVLGNLINPGIIDQWVESGLAAPLGGKPLFIIDLGQETLSRVKPSKAGKPGPAPERALTTWPIIPEALAAIKNPSPSSERNHPSLCVILNENALFLYAFDSERVVWLDMVQTPVRELNHFFFRCQGKEGKEGPPWEWTYQETGKVYEFVAFQKPPREIESYGEQAGRIWTDC